MRDRTDHQLLRHLHGELTPAEAQELRRQLAADPALAARLAALERTWRGLELPEPAAPPPGWPARLARLGADQSGAGGGFFALGAAPPWARALVAASLAAGLVLGLGLGGRLASPQPPAVPGAAVVIAEREPAPTGPGASRGAAGVADPLDTAVGDEAAGAATEIGNDGVAGGLQPPGERTTAAQAPAAQSDAADPSSSTAEAAVAAAEMADVEALLGDSGGAFDGGTTLAEEYLEVFAAGEVGW
jgi:hypothetical protein